MKEEMINIVDENDRVTNTVPRFIMRSENLLHRIVQILVFNPQGELFVHQRTFEKDLDPGCYDMTIAGTVNTESYDETAKRELQEEIGLNNVEIDYLFKTQFENEQNNTFIKVYKCVTDKKLTLQKEEIIKGKFMPIEEVKELIKKEKFTADGLATFQKYLDKQNETTQTI